MEKENVYQSLREHLNQQPIGYPATKSGVEIRILKRFFNPEEAQLATHLSFKPRSLERIYETAKKTGMSLHEMENVLDTMLKNRVIGGHQREGIKYYYNIPFVVGMYEGQVNKLSAEFLSEVDEFRQYFGAEYLRAHIPQMRTIPVGQSIPVDHCVTTYGNITDIINQTDGPIAILECICRKSAAIKSKPCKKTARMETCMAFGDSAKICINSGAGRSISKKEALDITRQNESEGLVLQPSNTQKVEFVCACCGCCCGVLGVHKMLPKPLEFWSTNYFALVDSQTCTGCGICVERCQVNAMSLDDGLNISKVNLDRCIGCGNCVVTCASEAISLVKKKEQVPPLDTEALYDTIMVQKQANLAKSGS